MDEKIEDSENMLKKPPFYKDKKVMGIISGAVLIVLFLVVIFTDVIDIVFNSKEYNAYKYAIECVKEELRYPNTATYPSFKDCSIEKSEYFVDILIDSPSDFEKAWDISGSGTCENAIGMTMNYSFKVTVVLDEFGRYWSYKCVVN